MKLYHGSKEENFVPTFGLGHDGEDFITAYMKSDLRRRVRGEVAMCEETKDDELAI